MNGSFSADHVNKVSEMLSGNFGEILSENYDFVRCQKADGSYYGTDTRCLSGIKTDRGPTQEKKVSEKMSMEKVAEKIRESAKKRSGRELTPQQIAAILAKDSTPVQQR